MVITDDMLEEAQNKPMSVISFIELIENILGVPFEEVYPEFNKGELNEEGNME